MAGAAVVLAAGSSKRYGSDKRLQQIDGVPMVRRSVDIYRKHLDHVVVVVKPNDDIVAHLPNDVKVVHAQESFRGMGHSLVAGINELETNVSWVLVALADMPWVSSETLAKSIALLDREEDKIVRPTYRNTPGHPVGFTSSYFGKLQNLAGDEGARDLLKSESGNLLSFEVDDPGILRDVDIPSHLES